MKTEATLAEVRVFSTANGNTRYVGRDADGNEYTTFRDEIGERARQLQGRRVRIEYHREQRGRYRNVYLDDIQPVEPDGATTADGDADPDEAAWRTAVEAAPWLIGEPRAAVPPKELYDHLKPFEQRVAEDIEQGKRDRREQEQDTRD
jgi:hypothetical protein